MLCRPVAITVERADPVLRGIRVLRIAIGDRRIAPVGAGACVDRRGVIAPLARPVGRDTIPVAGIFGIRQVRDNRPARRLGGDLRLVADRGVQIFGDQRVGRRINGLFANQERAFGRQRCRGLKGDHRRHAFAAELRFGKLHIGQIDIAKVLSRKDISDRLSWIGIAVQVRINQLREFQQTDRPHIDRDLRRGGIGPRLIGQDDGRLIAVANRRRRGKKGHKGGKGQLPGQIVIAPRALSQHIETHPMAFGIGHDILRPGGRDQIDGLFGIFAGLPRIIGRRIVVFGRDAVIEQDVHHHRLAQHLLFYVVLQNRCFEVTTF